MSPNFEAGEDRVSALGDLDTWTQPELPGLDLDPWQKQLVCDALAHEGPTGPDQHI